MRLRKMLFAGFVGSVVMFGLGAIGHTVVLRNLREGMLRERPLLAVIYGGVLVLSLLMAYLYSLLRKGGSPIAEGLRLGLLIGIAWTIPGGLARFGAQQGISLLPILLDAAWHLVEEGLGGIVIGLTYGRG